MKKKSLRGIVGLGAGLALIGAGAFAAAPSAQADPSSSGYSYVAVGSDTIQDLYNSFSAQSIGSWNATIPGASGDAALGGTIVPVNGLDPTNTTAIGRPNGSGDGRAALSAAWDSSNHAWTQKVTKTTGVTTTTYTVPADSIDIARSSGQPSAAHKTTAGSGSDDLTSVPLARDAVSVATYGFSFDFTEPELQAIYGAPDTTSSPASAAGVYTQSSTAATVGDVENVSGVEKLVTAVSNGVASATQTLNVKLPQASSGTRQFFQKALGNTANTTAGWVNDDNEENTASALTTVGDIIPFSAAQFISQYNGFATYTGVRNSNFHLNEIAGQAAYTLSGTTAAPGALFGSTGTVPDGQVGTFNRDVYSVVPTQVINGTYSSLTDPSYDTAITTLVTSTLPGLSNITNYGFESIGYSTTQADWIHSSWEN